MREHSKPLLRPPVPSSVRRAGGKDQRRSVPLESHAECPPIDERPDPVAILTSQDANRVQGLVPIRHGRMSATPFTFYRGAAAIMASDLSRVPSSELRTQLCGDAHLSNFGLFKGPDRRLVFDVNDFDETIPGPFEWDVKRLVASVEIAGRNNGLSTKQRRKATRSAIKAYRTTLASTAEKGPLQVHYTRLDVDEWAANLGKKKQNRAEKVTRKAHRKNSMRALGKLTAIVDGRRKIVPDPPLITSLDEAMERSDLDDLLQFFGQYRLTLPHYRRVLLDRFSIVDIAHKVVGVGSVGTRSFIVLLESGDGAPLFLQFKEATASVFEPFAGASAFDRAGERVVQGQRLMQATSDIFLGWSRFESRDGNRRQIDFYFRQLWDGKGSIDVDSLNAKESKSYARACGSTLAVAHARAGDAAMISGYLGEDDTFDRAVASFSETYADMNDLDYASHQRAIKSKRLPAEFDL